MPNCLPVVPISPVDVRYFGQDRPSCLFMSGCWGRLHLLPRPAADRHVGEGRGEGGDADASYIEPPLRAAMYLGGFLVLCTGPTNLSRLLLLSFGSMS